MSIILQTDRLTLRQFVPADLDDFYRLVTDPDVTRYTGDGGPHTLEEVRQGLAERVLADYQTHGFGRWAAVERATGRLIGFAGLKRLPELGEVDLGYRFFKEHWGRGLATEACRPIVEYGFGRLQLSRIIGLVAPEHRASARVLEKLGFQRGRLAPYRGQETVWYVLESKEWLSP
jgi:ribosomal-protein-alanine N-acetyltransferase